LKHKKNVRQSLISSHRPNWDDPCNEGGGRFILTRLELLDNEDFDHLWLEIVKFMMTSDADEVDYVAGALVKCRSNPTRRTISIWTMGNISHSNRLEIGELLKTHLHLDDNIYFGFHSELGQRALTKKRR
jgi:Eukaryotic initiation factor 4E